MILTDGGTRIALKNILVATDFSSASEAALNYAQGIARQYDAQMYVAHVIRPDAYQLVPPESQRVALEQTRRYAEQQMANLLVSGKLRGIPHQVLVDQGDFWTVLSDMIDKHEVDLVVVGTHGRTGVRKLLLGSVAEQIFRLAVCPVLTVGPRVSGEMRAEASLQRILYATDFTPTSERAAGHALSLAQEHQAQLTLLHVVQESAETSPRNIALMKEYFTKKLHELVSPEAAMWCNPEFVVEFGMPADGILRAAAEREADLIVLGVRRAATYPGHLPPATAYKVVCQAHSPVLTVRG